MTSSTASSRLWKVVAVVSGLTITYVIVKGLWITTDDLFGMYANYDGRWAAWNARGILEWSRFLDFSPFTPLVGTGSLFLPNLPWLNPGAIMLALPVPVAYQHLASYLVYLIVLVFALVLLFRELGLSSGQAFCAVAIYVCFFFPPFPVVSGALTWYSLAPVNAYILSVLSVALTLWLRIGLYSASGNALLVVVFVALTFAAFSSAPVTMITYVPVFAFVALAAVVTVRAGRELIWKGVTLIFAVAVLWLIGVPEYVQTTANVSARVVVGYPPFLHPGTELLKPHYWLRLWSQMGGCKSSEAGFLPCISSPIGWYQICGFVGAVLMVRINRGISRRLASAIALLILLFNFHALLAADYVLGPVHVVGTSYLFWTLFPFMAVTMVGGATTLVDRVRLGVDTKSMIRIILALSMAGFLWSFSAKKIFPLQPVVSGRGPLGLRPIAHVPPTHGDITAYLKTAIALRPGDRLRGYAMLFLSDDGYIRKRGHSFSIDSYIASRAIFSSQFGQMFQGPDLWNESIPTLEEYGQWVSRALFFLIRDLLAESPDQIDHLGSSPYVYRYTPELLQALGVRFIISDGALPRPAEEKATQIGKDGAILRLYELPDPNYGNFSPTQLVSVETYAAAIDTLRKQAANLRRTAVVIGRPYRPDLVPVEHAMLYAERDGYRVVARSRGQSLIVLPVQFTNCWKLRSTANAALLRVNVIQTGVVFQGELNASLQFDFQPWRAACRRQDAADYERMQLR